MTEITIQRENNLPQVNYLEKANEYLESMGSKLPTKQRTQFLEMAQAFGLNPFKREIYAVGYGDNWNIITGYEVYLKRAERCGKLSGWKAWIEGKIEDNSLKAIVQITRKDWEEPFIHEVYFEEVCNKTKDGKPNAIWAKMPKFMTKKVAIAQGFRMCFPDEFGGMPYTADEMGETETLQNVVVEEVKTTTNKESKTQAKKIAPTVERDKQTEAEIAELMKKHNDYFTEEIKKNFRAMILSQGSKKTLEVVKEFIKSKEEEKKDNQTVTQAQEKALEALF